MQLASELPFKKHRRERQAEKELRRSLIRMLKPNKSLVVYAEEFPGALTRFWLVGRDSGSRHQVRLFGWSYLKRTSVRISVDPSRVFLSVPEEYEEFQINSWRGCYVRRGTELQNTPLQETSSENAKP
jgi:hypothetical protein